MHFLFTISTVFTKKILWASTYHIGWCAVHETGIPVRFIYRTYTKTSSSKWISSNRYVTTEICVRIPAGYKVLVVSEKFHSIFIHHSSSLYVCLYIMCQKKIHKYIRKALITYTYIQTYIHTYIKTNALCLRHFLKMLPLTFLCPWKFPNVSSICIAKTPSQFLWWKF